MDTFTHNPLNLALDVCANVDIIGFANSDKRFVDFWLELGSNIFSIEGHLSGGRRIVGIQIGTQVGAWNASLLLDVDDSLRRNFAGGNPTRNGSLGLQSQDPGECCLTADPLASEKDGFFAHTAINAYNVNGVNAYSANPLPHSRQVGKQAESEASDFWKRLISAWGDRGLPTSQNGIATKLDMSQGSTRRWYTGEGYPEIDILRKLAEMGGVTIDWLLDERLPKSPISKQTALGKFLLLWEQLDDEGRGRVHRAALGEIALKPPRGQPAKKSGT